MSSFSLFDHLECIYKRKSCCFMLFYWININDGALINTSFILLQEKSVTLINSTMKCNSCKKVKCFKLEHTWWSWCCGKKFTYLSVLLPTHYTGIHISMWDDLLLFIMCNSLVHKNFILRARVVRNATAAHFWFFSYYYHHHHALS